MTGKDRFEKSLRAMLRREMRRRKTGRHIVLCHAVATCNRMRRDGSLYRWRLTLAEKTPCAQSRDVLQ